MSISTQLGPSLRYSKYPSNFNHSSHPCHKFGYFPLKFLPQLIISALMNMFIGPDSPMAASLRPVRDTTFFFGGGGPKKRVIKRIDLDDGGNEQEEEVSGFQESYVVPVLGRRVTYDDMRYAERFVLDTVDVLKTWNAIMEKRKQQEQQQAQHFDL